ncbi:response regulator [Paenibacillus sp.]|uniref:response regulator n=1 Tax=Paenibacillus sp. TaxID=58172 RepID=UPI002D5A265E|nr:response regulator [Paenibacillus sp.]HZG87953.1 response regulator [Paenibacillus sp.]
MPKALLVDDSAFMRMMIKDVLTQEGFDITEAENGVEAVALCKLIDFDFITLDITMPDMDGIAALEEIRHVNSRAYIVMMSAMGQQFFIKKALTCGANDFLIKPFTKETLRSYVRKVQFP